MSIEAMKQALEALENHMEQTRPINMTQNAIHALRQAIEQAEKQEAHKECVGLTDEEIALYDKRLSGSGVARDIEAKLKEKNGG